MSAKREIDRLILRDPSTEEIAEIHRQIGAAKDDRNAAILAALMVENAIVQALFRLNQRFYEMRSQLFEGRDGLLNTFAAKITVADSVGMFGPLSRHNAGVIRHIRNGFAHSRLPVSFRTTEIATACDELKRPAHVRDWDTPRHRYVTACHFLAEGLADYAARLHYIRADLIQPADTMVKVTPPPLP